MAPSCRYLPATSRPEPAALEEHMRRVLLIVAPRHDARRSPPRRLGGLLLDGSDGTPKERGPNPFADCVVDGAGDPAFRAAAEAAVEDQLDLASAVASRGPEVPGAARLKNVGVDHRC